MGLLKMFCGHDVFILIIDVFFYNKFFIFTINKYIMMKNFLFYSLLLFPLFSLSSCFYPLVTGLVGAGIAKDALSDDPPVPRGPINIQFTEALSGKSLSAKNLETDSNIIITAAAIEVPAVGEKYSKESQNALELCIKNNSGKLTAERFGYYTYKTSILLSSDNVDNFENISPGATVPALIFAGEVNCNLSQIENGWAKFNSSAGKAVLTEKEVAEYRTAENNAIKAGVGIWKKD